MFVAVSSLLSPSGGFEALPKRHFRRPTSSLGRACMRKRLSWIGFDGRLDLTPSLACPRTCGKSLIVRRCFAMLMVVRVSSDESNLSPRSINPIRKRFLIAVDLLFKRTSTPVALHLSKEQFSSDYA